MNAEGLLDEGDTVMVLTDEVFWMNEKPHILTETKVEITKIHPEETKPFDVECSPYDRKFEGVCGYDAILQKIPPICLYCGSDMVWHDKRKREVCPFCDIE